LPETKAGTIFNRLFLKKLYHMLPDRNFPEKSKDPKKHPEDKREHTEEAFEQAEEDMEQDPDLQPDENEDLDEGELARKEGHP
jgi:hypothetical protein